MAGQVGASEDEVRNAVTEIDIQYVLVEVDRDNAHGNVTGIGININDVGRRIDSVRLAHRQRVDFRSQLNRVFPCKGIGLLQRRPQGDLPPQCQQVAIHLTVPQRGRIRQVVETVHVEIAEFHRTDIDRGRQVQVRSVQHPGRTTLLGADVGIQAGVVAGVDGRTAKQQQVRLGGATVVLQRVLDQRIDQ